MNIWSSQLLIQCFEKSVQFFSNKNIIHYITLNYYKNIKR